MSPDFLFMYILIIHFMADFGMQTVYQAQNKSLGKNFFNKPLFYHVGFYSIIWFLSVVAISDITHWDIFKCFLFTFITFVCHYITDYTTSRVGKPFWENKDFHNGFVVVGFDQILHYIQLWYTFKLLM